MDKSGERTEKKRKKILQSAVALFLVKGIKKVTMDDIAAHANVSKMTIYKYFTDRDSLYQDVALSLTEKCRGDLAEKLDREEGAAERMVACTAVLTDFIAKGYSSLCNALASLDEHAGEKVNQFREDTKAVILGLIREGKRDGLIKGNLSDSCIYHYIDMGLSYFQNNGDYREKMLHDASFRNEFMAFLWSAVFNDIPQFIP